MTTTTISSCTVDEFEREPNLDELFAEYASEASIEGLGECRVQMQMYRQLETAGVLHPIVAHQDDKLVGFLSLLISVVPHYGCRIATTESFFVAKAARAGGAGMKLLRAAEDKARELGVQGLFISAPAGGRLSAVLPHAGYRKTNEVFFRGFE